MTIDWSKPIRTVIGNVQLTIISYCSNTNRFVTWGEEPNKFYAFVRTNGSLIASLHGNVPNCHVQFVENIPKEPRNTLIVGKNLEISGWNIWSSIPLTRSEAEKVASSYYDGRPHKFITLGEGEYV